MGISVSVVDGGADLRDVRLLVDEVMGDAHGVEDRLDDAHPVARRIARRGARVMLQQADHHADRLRIFDRDAADGVYRIEKAGVLDQGQRALVAIGEPGRDADAFVLLAHADELECGVARDRPQQAAAGDDVGHRQHVFDAARLERGDDRRAFELDLVIAVGP